MAVKQFINPEVLKRDMAFSTSNLSEAFSQQASLFSYYAEKHAQAERQESRIKMTLDMREAQADRRIRKEAKAEGEKFTEPQIAKLVLLDPTVAKLNRDYIDAKQISAICKAAVEGFRHRRDMLIQLGADAREEKKGTLRMTAGSAGERAHSMMGTQRRETAQQD